ncbi:lamin tail domain-containing protein [Actinoplanes sp. CA-030573]|uniref:lamin tail domain-containing protein n=1 Tax=Actinoplanes sp. CA-030573 TaxID=3239898 RepID=UPI003D912A74
MRRTAVGVLSLSTFAAAGWLTATPAAANPAGTGLVISEAYVNGGSAGATYQNKFVELYNPTASAIPLAGDSLQYRAPASTVTPIGSQVFALSGSVPAHGHFLIQLPGNGANGAVLPDADLTTGTSVNPGAAGGTLYVAAGTTGVLPTDAAVIDKIGYGTSNSPEGTAPSGNSVVLSYQRAASGVDSDNNAADFSVSSPTPENSGTTGGGGGDEPEDLTIAQIQGTGDTSPYVDKSVRTTGVVTAAYPTGGFNGFFLETPGPDTTPGASDGIFVFGSISAAQVAVGDSVQVTGKVAEFQGETEITSPAVTGLAAPLPAVTPRAALVRPRHRRREGGPRGRARRAAGHLHRLRQLRRQPLRVVHAGRR